MVQVTSPTSLAIDSPQGRKLFVFDRVFAEDVSQEGVWEYLVESVNAFVQGYNVSMLAYGQSGAGKSYTMGTSGPSEQGDMDMMGKSKSESLIMRLLVVAISTIINPRKLIHMLCQVSSPEPALHSSKNLMVHDQAIETPCRDSGRRPDIRRMLQRCWRKLRRKLGR